LPFAIQKEICDKVMAAIEAVYLAERLRAEHIPPKTLNVWECIVRALALMNTRGQENAGKAHDLLQRAISLECQSTQAHSLLSISRRSTLIWAGPIGGRIQCSEH
jgi:hypothetical protein